MTQLCHAKQTGTSKCLKPVSERKIRRELLVLTHCATLPNLARLIGIVIPEYMEGDDGGNEEDLSLQQREKRRLHTPQQEQQDDGSTQPTGEEPTKTVDASVGTSPKITGHRDYQTSSKINTNSLENKSGNDDGGNHHEKYNGKQLPALVLEHAGQTSRWFCHGSRPSFSSIVDSSSNPKQQPQHHNHQQQQQRSPQNTGGTQENENDKYNLSERE